MRRNSTVGAAAALLGWMAVSLGCSAGGSGADAGPNCEASSQEQDKIGAFTYTRRTSNCDDGTCTRCCDACHTPSGHCERECVPCGEGECTMPTVAEPERAVWGDGDGCSADSWGDCAAGLVCRPQSPEDSGDAGDGDSAGPLDVCAPPPGPGDPCAAVGQCPAGYGCRRSADDGPTAGDRCHPSPGEVCRCFDLHGASCWQDEDCGEGLRCVQQRCVAQVRENEPCALQEPNCAEGLECHWLEGDDTARCLGPDALGQAELGQPCGADDDCTSRLCRATALGKFCTIPCAADGCPTGWQCTGDGDHCTTAGECPTGYAGEHVLRIDGAAYGMMFPPYSLVLEEVDGPPCLTGRLGSGDQGQVAAAAIRDGALVLAIEDYASAGGFPAAGGDSTGGELLLTASRYGPDTLCGTYVVRTRTAGPVATGTFAAGRAGVAEPASARCE